MRLSGVDVRDLSAGSIREMIGMVTQDGHLFHESVRATLLPARPRVVILDETTAHLDSTLEAAVWAALAGRTAMVIAHRLSTIRAANLILVIGEGRVVECGTHTAGGGSEELHRTQFNQPTAVVTIR